MGLAGALSYSNLSPAHSHWSLTTLSFSGVQTIPESTPFPPALALFRLLLLGAALWDFSLLLPRVPPSSKASVLAPLSEGPSTSNSAQGSH